MKQKPALLLDEHLIYLDRLRKRGITNMFGAGPYLQRQFSLSQEDAHEVLGYWMDTFSERHEED